MPTLRTLRVARWIAALLVVVVVVVVTCAAGCHRRRRHGAAAAAPVGPRLGARAARVGAVRVLNPPRSAARGPFTQVALLAGGALGVARGRLYRLEGDGGAGDTRAVDAFGADPVHSIASAGGRVVYALVAAQPAYLARSDDGGQTFTRGAVLRAAPPLPERPDDPARLTDTESLAGLAARDRTVVFWLGETALVSRDGGATVAPLDLGGAVRSLVVTARGSVVALARLAPPPEGDPIGVVRAELAGEPARVARVSVLGPGDACAAGQVYALADGSVMLGGRRGILGQCARRSRDDGRSFAALEGVDATTAQLALGTPAGAVLVRAREGAPLTVLAAQGAAASAEVGDELLEVAHDVAPDGASAVGLRDGLVRAPGGSDAARAAVRDEPRGALAFAATRDAIAAMNARGAITVVERDAQGSATSSSPRVRVVRSPCRFAPDTLAVRDVPALAFDGRRRICCATLPGAPPDRDSAPGVHCASLDAAAPVFTQVHPLGAPVASGEGAVAIFGEGAHCLAHDAPRPVPAGSRLGLRDTARVLELSCAAPASALAHAAACAHDGPVAFGAAFELRAGDARVLAPSTGLRPRVLARAGGTVVAALETERGPSVRVYAPGARRAAREWSAGGARADAPSLIAPWDASAAVLTLRTALVVASPSGIATRAFADGERYEAVARVGDALLGVTADGRFAELAARPP